MNLMRVKVLRTVEVATNIEGTASKLIVSGTHDEIGTHLFEMLRDAGYVAEPESQQELGLQQDSAATPPAATRDPLDHDGDGRKGGSLPKSRRAPR